MAKRWHQRGHSRDKMESSLLGPASSLRHCEWGSPQQRRQEGSLLRLKHVPPPPSPPGSAKTQFSALSKHMSSFRSDPDLPLQSLVLAKQKRKMGDWACPARGSEGFAQG